MAFKLENFGSEVANAKSILGGVAYYRYWNQDNDDLSVAGYFPKNLGLKLGDRITVIPTNPADGNDEPGHVSGIQADGTVEVVVGS